MGYHFRNDRFWLQRSWILLLALVLGAGTLAAPTTAQPAADPAIQELLARGQELLAKERPKKAIKAFTEAVELSDHQSLAALHALARAALQGGDLELAIESAEGLLEVADAPGDRMIGFQILGTAHLESRKGSREAHLSAATDAFRQAMNLAAAVGDTSGTAQYSLAMALEESGATDEALDLLRSFPYQTAPSRLAVAAGKQFCRVRGPSTPEHLDPGPFDSTSEGITAPLWIGASRAAEEAVPAEVEGEVDRYEIRLLVDRDGCVAEVESVEGSAAPKWLLDRYVDSVYFPALKDGQTVAVHHVIQLDIATTVSFEPVL